MPIPVGAASSGVGLPQRGTGLDHSEDLGDGREGAGRALPPIPGHKGQGVPAESKGIVGLLLENEKTDRLGPDAEGIARTLQPVQAAAVDLQRQEHAM